MRSRQRKLIGTIIMLSFVVVYALVAMVVAQATAMRIESLFWRTIIFALLGLGWAVADGSADQLDGKARSLTLYAAPELIPIRRTASIAAGRPRSMTSRPRRPPKRQFAAPVFGNQVAIGHDFALAPDGALESGQIVDPFGR